MSFIHDIMYYNSLLCYCLFSICPIHASLVSLLMECFAKYSIRIHYNYYYQRYSLLTGTIAVRLDSMPSGGLMIGRIMAVLMADWMMGSSSVTVTSVTIMTCNWTFM